MTLHEFDRRRALQRIADEPFDVLVVGGGITGAGVALDAASRGLRAALVERDDFASGTSSKSSKLVHGGLRYLQHGEFRLVYEALAERQTALRNAPHLVRPLPFLIPMFSKDGFLNPRLARALGVAMWQYDLTGGMRIGARHRRLSRAEVVERAAVLDTPRLHSGYLYHDAQADDARYTLAILRTAACDHGAAVAARCAFVGRSAVQGSDETVFAVEADGERIEVRAAVLVNATGVWSDRVASLAGDAAPLALRPAKGVHITLPRSLLPIDVAIVLPVPGDRRSVFVVPWDDHAYVGTTDTDYDGPLDDVLCTPEEVDYLLRALNAAIATPVRPADVVGSWAGLRPLVAGAGNTVDLSRRHTVAIAGGDVVNVTGGKLTTWRRMAADAVDAALPILNKERRCRTRWLRLRGSEGWDRISGGGVDPDLAEHLAGRYGGEARIVLALMAERPELAEPLVPGLPYRRAEAVFAARYEQAGSVDDVLSRRTRARLLDRDASAASAQLVAELMGVELGWGPERRLREVRAYLDSVERERAALEPAAAAAS